MHGAAKSVGKTFNQSPGIAVVTGLVWADSPPGACYTAVAADTVVVDLFGRTGNTGAARRGIELRGFHGWRRTGRQRGGTEREREREIEGERERQTDRGWRVRRDAA